MATVDYGVIVRSDDTWVYVKPRCPHCGYLEQSDWNVVSIGIPKIQYSKKTQGYTCHKCWKGFTISVYPG
jgi:DNA-directed RNA polymerase subunit RPC12/RpoP